MKVLRLTAILLSIALLCSGCQAVRPATDENENIIADIDGASKNIEKSELKKVNMPENGEIICSYDNYLVYIIEVEGTRDEENASSYNIRQLHRYNMANDTCEYVAELGHVFASTADGEYIDGRVYFPCVNESGNQLLLAVDIKSGAVETVFERELWAIFYYMEKLDDSLILFTMIGASATDTEYRIEKIIPGEMGSVATLLSRTASDNAGSEGEFITCVKTYESSIYTYGAVYNNESQSWDYCINEYDSDGQKAAAYEIDADTVEKFTYMEDEKDYDTVWSFDISDSYIMLHTLNERIEMFKLGENEELINVDIPEELFKDIPGDYPSISEHSSDGGIMYAAASELKKDNLYVFDTKRAEFSVYTVPFEENEHMNILYDTPDGKLLIKIEQITDEGYENPRIYMLDASRL